MKQIFLIVLIASVLMISGSKLTPKSLAQSQSKEVVVVEITDKVSLQDKILQGSYIFEHDDERMAKGEPCMYVYTNNKGKPGEKVVAFHCTPVAREVSKTVVLSVTMTTDPTVWKLKEIQFAGSTKGHLVP
jgi:hypothetical protein